MYANEIADPANAGVYGSGPINYGTRFRVKFKAEQVRQSSSQFSATDANDRRCVSKSGCSHFQYCAVVDSSGSSSSFEKVTNVAAAVYVRNADGTITLDVDEPGTGVGA